MKILYSAFECNPYKGSEAFCGWSWVINMSKYNDVSVITRNENKNNIEKFCNENDVKNIKFYYCDITECLNFYYKYGKFYMYYYVLWQKKAYKLAKKICQENKFDIIHHITLGDFRCIGKMWKLDSNYVFGPVGGAQYIPKKLKKYSKGHKLNELYRKIINESNRIKPSYIKAVSKAKRIYCANPETYRFMSDICNESEKCKLLTENGINSIKNIKKFETKDIIKIIWLGRIVYRKGIELLIDATKYIDTNKKFEIHIYGYDEGNEIRRLKQKINNLNLQNKVFFDGEVDYKSISKIYEDADIFVFPSLRETTRNCDI